MIRKAAAVFAAFICTTVCIYAEDFEGRRISAIDYPGAQPALSGRDFAAAQLLKVGEPYSAERVGEAIDRLFATGMFSDIQVDAAQATGGGVALKFQLTLQWFVGHIGAEGKIKTPPNRGHIINVSRLSLEQPFDDTLVPTAERRVRRLLERNGLYEGTVNTYLLRDPDAQQIHLTFMVRSGKRAKYDEPVIQGDTKLPDKTIIKATGWKKFLIGGYRQVTEDRTRNAVRGILRQYQKKDRLMAKVDIKNLEYEKDRRRVKGTLDINGGPRVKVRTIEAKVSKGKLKKYVPIYDEQRVDRDLLVEGARNLRDYFQQQGYYDADIDFRERPEGNDETVIEYVISRGDRFKLVNVGLEGNKYFDRETIRERMFLEPAGLIRFRHGRYSEAMRKKDEENITNLYKSNGFRDVKVVSEVQRDYKGKAGDIGVVFRIEEGPQWFVAGLQLEGVQNMNHDEIVSKLSSSEGQPFAEINVAADRSTILTEYFMAGYSDATFEWASAPAGEPNRVNLRYIVTEGRQRFIRDVFVNGLTVTRPNTALRRIKIEPGDPLSPIAVTDSQKSLYETGVFAKVTTAVQNPEGTTQDKHVIYDVEEGNRYNLNFGLGAEFGRLGGVANNTLSAPSGSTGFSPRFSVDLGRINAFGLGHLVNLRGRVSSLEERASIDYTAPRFRNVEGRTVTFTALWDNTHYVNTFSSKREEASIQLSQQFSKTLTGLFRYTWRYVTTYNVQIPALLVPQLLQPVKIGMLSGNVVHDRRNDPADPSRGIFSTGDLSIAARPFGSQRTFVRALGRNSTYHRITRNTILARETTFGVVKPFRVAPGLTPEEYIPLPERFFGGGSTSHRGFPENQAGPRDIGTVSGTGEVVSRPTGFPLGGNALFFNMTELRFPLIGENIRGVFFHDMGNIYSSIGKMSFRVTQRDLQDFDYMVHAAGFGIRYKTPVGPVRIDLAYSINPPSFLGFKGTIRDLLTCDPNVPVTTGPCASVRQNVSHFQFFFSIGQTF